MNHNLFQQSHYSLWMSYHFGISSLRLLILIFYVCWIFSHIPLGNFMESNHLLIKIYYLLLWKIFNPDRISSLPLICILTINLQYIKEIKALNDDIYCLYGRNSGLNQFLRPKSIVALFICFYNPFWNGSMFRLHSNR